MRLISEDRIDYTSLWISRIVTVLTGVAATLLVVNPPPYLGTFIWIGISGIAAGTLGPILVGLFLPYRANATAAKISLVAGVVSYLVIYFFLDFEESVLAAGAWAVLIGIAVMLAASYVFPGRAGERLEAAEETGE